MFFVLLAVLGMGWRFGLLPSFGPVWSRAVIVPVWLLSGWYVSTVIIRRFHATDSRRWLRICACALSIWVAGELAGYWLGDVLGTTQVLGLPESLISKLGHAGFVVMPAIFSVVRNRRVENGSV